MTFSSYLFKFFVLFFFSIIPSPPLLSSLAIFFPYPLIPGFSTFSHISPHTHPLCSAPHSYPITVQSSLPSLHSLTPCVSLFFLHYFPSTSPFLQSTAVGPITLLLTKPLHPLPMLLLLQFNMQVVLTS